MFLFVVLLAVFLGIMTMAVILPFKPDLIKVTEKFICAKNEKMEIFTSVAGHHLPGERSIEIYCTEGARKRDVKLKTLLLCFILSSVAMLPFSYLIITFGARLIGE
jgi:hypothetical protein